MIEPQRREGHEEKQEKIEEEIMDIEDVAKTIVDSAIKVHRELGPGLLESAYQKCLAYELGKRGLNVQCEVEVPIVYDGQTFDVGYRIDMLVEKSIIIENKTVDQFAPIHQAILLTYLKMRGLQLGFLLNWKTLLMKNGIKRMINTPGYPSRKLQRLLLIFFVFFASLRLIKEILWQQY